MKKILKKIPLIFFAVLLSAMAFEGVKLKYIIGLTLEQIHLFSGLLTIIGLIFVAINLQRQWKNERIKTEYLNQPEFSLQGSLNEEFKDSRPSMCKRKQCTDEHWFNLIQNGNLAARKLNVGLFYKDESKIDIRIKDRWLKKERLGKNDRLQYKLPPSKIPIKYYNEKNLICFVLLMEYQSEYSRIKYKRIYQLCALVKDSTNVKDWKNISFYENSLINTLDSESITLIQILTNYFFKILRVMGIKKDFTKDEWLIDL